MNRGVARDDVFFADVDRSEFERMVAVSSDRFGVEVHAYCLMPNHFHLVLHCPHGGLSGFVQLAISVFTRHVNERVGRDGPLFRGRFRSRQIRDDRYLRTAVRYVHRNPLALPGVAEPERYRWSSHRAYLGLRRRQPWLQTERVLAMFDGDRRRFDDFVTGPDAPLGPIDPDELERAIWIAIEETSADLERSPQGLARTVMHLALDELDPHRVGDPVWRARQQARRHPVLVEAARRALRIAAA